MNLARALRAVSSVLEAGLVLLAAGSAAFIGSVQPPAYVAIWYASLALGLLVACRSWMAWLLRKRLGPCRFSFHPSWRRLVVGEASPYDLKAWSFDLGRSLLPIGPLLVPGLFFLVWVLIQLVPLPPGFLAASGPTPPLASDVSATEWRRITVSVPDTLRGLAFLASALLVHLAASAALDRGEARDAFARRIRVLGLIVSAAGLVQFASGTKLIYSFSRHERPAGLALGMLVNRDHFATYMLMLIPLALGHVASAYRRYAAREGGRPSLRQRLVRLSAPEGITLLYACLPALACVSALISTTSRGGLLAFGGSLVLAAVSVRSRSRAPVWAFVLVFVGMAVSWFGVERIEARFVRSRQDLPGRTLLWADTLSRMEGRWITGHGFNAFAEAMSRSTAWALPLGATPWTSPDETAIASQPRAGLRAPEGTPGLAVYNEAHSDYVQILAETGLPGLLLALWAAWRLLRTVRRDPWLLAAVAGVLMHAFVDFGLQIPAVTVLFVTIAGMRPRPARDEES
jgi:O-antigen ligase